MISFEVYNSETGKVLETIKCLTERKAKQYVYDKYKITRLKCGKEKPAIKAVYEDPNYNKKELLDKFKNVSFADMRELFCQYNCDLLKNYKYKELSTAYILERAFHTTVNFNLKHKGEDAIGILHPDQINNRIEMKSTTTNAEDKLMKFSVAFDKQANEQKRQDTQQIGCLVISLFSFREYIFPDYILVLDMFGEKHKKWIDYITKKQDEYLRINIKSKGRTTRLWQPLNVTIKDLYENFQNDLFVIKYNYQDDTISWSNIEELKDKNNG